jgi:HSP90 family molecular chaperone
MKKTHRVYLKNMLLAEQTEGLLPDWAFFVKCVVNARDLRPTPRARLSTKITFWKRRASISGRSCGNT